MFESASLNNINTSSELNIYKNTFDARNDYLANKEYFNDRSQNSKLPKNPVRVNSIWERKPVDFTWKLYHPKPPKRNSREAIKPWQYDKFLKPIESLHSSSSFNLSEKSEENFGNKYLSESLNKMFNLKEESLDLREFSTLFKPLTASKDKIDTAKTMSYRDGLDQYEGSINKFHPRELKPQPGMPDFAVKTEKDPFGIKFHSQRLNQIHGPGINAVMRKIEEGPQMADSFNIKHLKYDPSLVLPQMKFPNKYNCYTRHRVKNERTPDSAYWDRVLPKIKKQWQEEALQNSLTSSLP